jgi:hypothetical protein
MKTFGPRATYNLSLGSQESPFDFSLQLDPSYSALAISHPLNTTRVKESLDRYAECFPKYQKRIVTTVHDQSVLLESITLPGKDGSLALDSAVDPATPTIYRAGGVANVQAAHALLGIWSSWAWILGALKDTPADSPEISPLAFTYAFDGLLPSPQLGGYGFSFQLHASFAKQAYATPYDENLHRQLQTDAKQILIDTKLIDKKEKYWRPRFNFVDKTSLLQWTEVPGDACDLGIDGNDVNYTRRELADSDLPFDYFIPYNPHNVDTSAQAFALLAQMVLWHDAVKKKAPL